MFQKSCLILTCLVAAAAALPLAPGTYVVPFEEK